MPLVKSQNTEVTLTDSATVVLDWVRIDDYADFTVVLSNSGDTNAVTDAVLQLSADGSTVSDTVTLDLPAAGIAALTAYVSDTQTLDAAYARLVANCDSNLTTTVLGWLLAATVTPHLCTLADLKDRLGFNGSDDVARDTELTRIAREVEALFDKLVGYPLLKTTDTFYLTGTGSRYLQVQAKPLLSVASVVVSYDYSYTDDALVENTDYRLANGGKDGVLLRLYTSWPTQEESIKVVATAGYCGADVTPATGELALPADLRGAAIMQTCYQYSRKDDLGLQNVSGKSSSITKESDTGLLKEVELILDHYKIKSFF